MIGYDPEAFTWTLIPAETSWGRKRVLHIFDMERVDVSKDGRAGQREWRLSVEAADHGVDEAGQHLAVDVVSCLAFEFAGVDGELDAEHALNFTPRLGNPKARIRFAHEPNR